MAIGFDLSHSAHVPVLILNANIIPLLMKPPADDGAFRKITDISGASIFGGSVTIQLCKKSYNTKGQYRWFAAGNRNFWVIISLLFV